MVPGTDWVEPALVWLTISMPTGSRKTTVYQFLMDIIKSVRRQVYKGECVCVVWFICPQILGCCILFYKLTGVLINAEVMSHSAS